MTYRRKILLVSSAFFPEISPRSLRATELAKEFFRSGHDVTVITNFRDYDYSVFLGEFQLSFKMWNKSILPKVPDFKQKHLSFLSRAISRILLLLFEYPNIEEMFRVKGMLNNETGYDLMISFAVPYPVHWGVAWARTKNHQIAENWVADCGDPYMGDVLDSFKHPFYFKYLEKSFCRKADFISIPIEGAKEGYYSEFQKKIIIIPQGFDFDLAARIKDFEANDIPRFAYAGSFMKGIRDPKRFILYLVNINVPFRFLVYTSNPELLNEYKDKLKDKLLISDYISRDELMNVLAKMDFLINFDNNTSLNSPSKLIDYAILNRPVLNVDKNFQGEDLMAFIKGDYSKRMILPDPVKHHIKYISMLFLDILKT